MFQEDSGIDYSVLERRCRRMRWILQDAKSVSQYFKDKMLSNGLKVILENLLKELSDVEKLPPHEGHLYATSLAINRWQAMEHDYKLQKAVIDNSITNAQDESDKKISELIISDIEACFVSSLELNLHEQQQEKLQDSFAKALEVLTVPEGEKAPGPSCFISYAWGVSKHEAWAHRFATKLQQLGINVYLDIWHNQFESVAQFTEKLYDVDYILIIGTPLLKSKWENKEKLGYIVAQELEQIFDVKRETPNKIIKLLLDGKNDDSFPRYLRGFSCAATDFSDERYEFEPFFNLLLKLYEKEIYQARKEFIKEAQKQFIDLCQTQESTRSESIAIQLTSHIKEMYQKDNKIKRLFYPPLDLEGNYIHLTVIADDEQRKRERQLIQHHQRKRESQLIQYHQRFLNHVSMRTCSSDDEDEEEKETDECERPFVYEDFSQPKMPIAAEKILEQFGNEKNHVLITGIAGVGKTTLSQYLSYAWSSVDKEDGFNPWRKQFSLVMVFPLRLLLTSEYCNQKKIVDIVRHYFLPASFSKPDSIQSVTDKLEIFLNKEEKAGRILWVLDGYDEIAKSLRSQAPILSLFKEWLKARHIIITSRPYYFSELENNYSFKEPRKLQITGFTDENIEQYVFNFFKRLETPKEEQARKIYRFLRASPNIWGVCHTPITLELVCSAWERQPIIQNSITMSELYDKIIVGLLTRTLKRRIEVGETVNIDIPVSADEDILGFCDQELEFLEYWAMEGIIQETLVYSIKNALEYISNKYFSALPAKEKIAQRNKLVSELLTIGLFKSIEKGERIAEEACYFPHRTFQEYFAARYLVRCFKEKNSSIHKLSISMHDYIIKNRYDANLELMWWFTSGILFNQKLDNHVNSFFNLLIIPPLDVLALYQAQLILRCWDETRCFLLEESIKKEIQTIITQALKVHFNCAIENKAFLERFRLSPFVFSQDWIFSLIQKQLNNKDKVVIIQVLFCISTIDQISDKLMTTFFNLINIHQKNISYIGMFLNELFKLVIYDERLQQEVINYVLASTWDIDVFKRIYFSATPYVLEHLSHELTVQNSTSRLKRALNLCFFIKRPEFIHFSENIIHFITASTDIEIKLVCLELLMKHERYSVNAEQVKWVFSSLDQEIVDIQSRGIDLLASVKDCLEFEDMQYANTRMLSWWSKAENSHKKILGKQMWSWIIALGSLSEMDIDIFSQILNEELFFLALKKDPYDLKMFPLDCYEQFLLNALQQTKTQVQAVEFCNNFSKMNEAVVDMLYQMLTNITLPLYLRGKIIETLFSQLTIHDPLRNGYQEWLMEDDFERLLFGLYVYLKHKSFSAYELPIKRLKSVFLCPDSQPSIQILSAMSLAKSNSVWDFFAQDFSILTLSDAQRWALKLVIPLKSIRHEFLSTTSIVSLCPLPHSNEKNNYSMALLQCLFNTSHENIKANMLVQIMLWLENPNPISLQTQHIFMLLKNIKIDFLDKTKILINRNRMVETVEVMIEMMDVAEAGMEIKIKVVEIMEMRDMRRAMEMKKIIEMRGRGEADGDQSRLISLWNAIKHFVLMFIVIIDKNDFESLTQQIECWVRIHVIFWSVTFLSYQDLSSYLSDLSLKSLDAKFLYLALKSTSLLAIVDCYLLKQTEVLLPIIVLRLLEENTTLTVREDRHIYLQGKYQVISQQLVPKELNIEDILKKEFEKIYLKTNDTINETQAATRIQSFFKKHFGSAVREENKKRKTNVVDTGQEEKRFKK